MMISVAIFPHFIVVVFFFFFLKRVDLEYESGHWSSIDILPGNCGINFRSTPVFGLSLILRHCSVNLAHYYILLIINIVCLVS